MTQSQPPDSIKIYCAPQFKKQIKNIAFLENKSISQYITNILEEHLTQSIKPSRDNLAILKKDMDRLELLTLSLFKDLYSALGKDNSFEEICSSIYREDQ